MTNRNLEKLAIYYRVSTDKQDIASQKLKVEEYLINEDIDPSKLPVYKDEGLTGSDANRPQFQQMIADAIHGKIKNIIVYKIGRFSRSANDAIRIILELDDHGVGFISATQPALNMGRDMPFRRTILSAFAEIAQIEKENLLERMQAGREAAKARGVVFGAKIKLSEKVVARIVELKDEQKLSFSNIAKIVKSTKTSVHRAYKKHIEEKAKSLA